MTKLFQNVRKSIFAERYNFLDSFAGKPVHVDYDRVRGLWHCFLSHGASFPATFEGSRVQDDFGNLVAVGAQGLWD